MEPSESSLVSSESPDSDVSSRDRSDASTPDDGAPTPTAARIAARQLGAHVSGPRPNDGEEIREGGAGRARSQTRALHQESAAGLIGGDRVL